MYYHIYVHIFTNAPQTHRHHAKHNFQFAQITLLDAKLSTKSLASLIAHAHQQVVQPGKSYTCTSELDNPVLTVTVPSGYSKFPLTRSSIPMSGQLGFTFLFIRLSGLSPASTAQPSIPTVPHFYSSNFQL